jgi:hypothetical protein
MDEQLSTWMDCIWSSWCLAFSCTSTQSNNLKWASGGGINSPRHQTNSWLKAAESSTVGWFDAIFFQVSVHPVLLAVALHCTWPLTQLLRSYAPMHRQFIRCWRPRGQNVSVSFHATVGWTAADLSVHLVLKRLSWRVFLLIQMKRQIDR